MTVTTQQFGYLDHNYLVDAYLSGGSYGNDGWQTNAQILDFPQASGWQCLAVIEDSEQSTGWQSEASILESLTATGWQASITIEESVATGWQASGGVSTESSYGFEANQAQNVFFKVCNGYLDAPYLVNPYLAAYFCGSFGWQATAIIEGNPTATGWQASATIVDYSDAIGWQASAIVDTEAPTGWQAAATIEIENATGWQVAATINTETSTGWQALGIVEDDQAVGWQADQIIGTATGWQATISLYNSTQLRILCEFPSRGTSGTNWTSSSTASGDFSANNLNTDIVEQVWRSGGLGTVNIDCDTQIPQGIAMDTFGLFNHNLTSGAVVNLLGSDNPAHGPVGITIPIQILGENNCFFVSEDLPTDLWRYWRISIQDITNPDGYYQVGTVVFGASSIFTVEENFTDRIGFTKKDFSDKVNTEGFTNVANSRALKKLLNLKFQSLNSSLSNISILQGVFDTFRTTHKCLWIPTPDFSNPETTAKWAVFAKLSQIPMENHKSVDNRTDYITLDVNLDESL